MVENGWRCLGMVDNNHKLWEWSGKVGDAWEWLTMVINCGNGGELSGMVTNVWECPGMSGNAQEWSKTVDMLKVLLETCHRGTCNIRLLEVTVKLCQSYGCCSGLRQVLICYQPLGVQTGTEVALAPWIPMR